MQDNERSGETLQRNRISSSCSEDARSPKPSHVTIVIVNGLRTGITIMIYTLVVIALGVKPQPRTHSEV